MQINFNASFDPVAKTGQTKPKAQPAAAGADGAAFEKSQALERALQNTEAVRAEKVAHARRLLNDVMYPPQETIKSIANLLAIEFSKESDKA